ncbi:LysR family transcriptional regulator [Gordonia otitidis]|uniref:LysR family transcriptional regulator n=1 Tax=Gordonia otitidis TaxID=249058 RepID=UPI001D139829|nr:LysR family transcriptional regulator [Gordonia otitidis]UEA58135.1 LysR family transcriptional regulator [Gordonia otitidis]
MEIRHLRTFLAVAEHRTVLGAASALDLAPSSVSQQIRVLERDLGVELFTRSPTGMRLTEPGLVLAAEGPEHLARWSRLRRSVSTAAAAAPLRIASTEHMVATQIPGVLREFRARVPQRTVVVDTLSDPTSVVEAVASGDSDVGLVLDMHDDEADRWLLPATQRADVSYADIVPVTTAVAMSADHRLAGHDRLTIGDLIGEHVLGGPRRCATHLGVEDLLHEPMEPMPSLVVAMSWAANGLGVVMAPKFTIGGSSSIDRLAAVDLDITSHTSWIRMVWATERQAIGDFRDLLYATSTGVTGDVGAPELGGVRRGDIQAAS